MSFKKFPKNIKLVWFNGNSWLKIKQQQSVDMKYSTSHPYTFWRYICISFLIIFFEDKKILSSVSSLNTYLYLHLKNGVKKEEYNKNNKQRMIYFQCFQQTHRQSSKIVNIELDTYKLRFSLVCFFISNCIFAYS